MSAFSFVDILLVDLCRSRAAPLGAKGESPDKGELSGKGGLPDKGEVSGKGGFSGKGQHRRPPGGGDYDY